LRIATANSVNWCIQQTFDPLVVAKYHLIRFALRDARDGILGRA
jgi:hypothetical protein